ncbi:MAG: hypothetical protein A3J76_00030 [Candidatus Moranbacteria bacterium RBG_13_45_13]|nr:MAG: hypothetical protein A3J76_00030 [Candidatus Moranbacteria bacterium RBG_13_45_13]
MDWFIKRKLRVKNYFRYADDFVVIHPETDYLMKVLRCIDEFLKKEMKLELHPDKVIIRKFRQGIDFLGYVVLPHYTALRTKTKRRMLKKLKSRYKEMERGATSPKSYEQSLQSYFGILKHCEGRKIKNKISSLFCAESRD